ncbi:MAG: hypothetical protein K8T89_23005 [Planctomycetes bacterium]|nr:hypothetical protein [Planctomycetota bacterium]
MPYRANYPATVAEVLSDRRKYKPEALKALRAFRRSKPWRGTFNERREKFGKLHEELCRVYGLCTQLKFWARDVAYYSPGEDRINLPTLSVVTYLHEFAHARGADERQACGWSINLFRRIFPRSFARCRHHGHMLVAPTR